MAKDPAFLFYSSDFLTGTMLMSNEQIGMYIKLMCLQHQKGKLTEKDMLNICRTYDEDVFGKFEKDEHGLYENKRLAAEIQRRRDYAESRRSNRKGKNISQSYVPHMENENENETVDKEKRKKGAVLKKVKPPAEENFDQFWEAYNNKIDKKKAKDAWGKLSETDRQNAIAYIPIYKSKLRDLKYQKHPTTYINGRNWEDGPASETPVVSMHTPNLRATADGTIITDNGTHKHVVGKDIVFDRP